MLPTQFHLERPTLGSQLTDVVDGMTEDQDLGDPAISVTAGHHVAQMVEVAFEVVAALALHHIVLSALVPLVHVYAAV